MAKKNIYSGIVYSTDKEFKFDEEIQENIDVQPADQKLKICLDTKHRGGKAVTMVEGYKGKGADEVGKKLKMFCGTGGSVKDGHIFVQGDNREKVFQWLLKNGFKNVKKV